MLPTCQHQHKRRGPVTGSPLQREVG